MLGRIVSALSVAAIAGGVVYAQAAEEAAPSREVLAKAHDPAAITTRAEARAYAEWEFFYADADMDDVLSEKEYAALVLARQGHDLESAETEHRGFAEMSEGNPVLTKETFVGARIAEFQAKFEAPADDGPRKYASLP